MAKKTIEGLTEKEAKKRLEQYGFNEIRDIGKTSLFTILLRQVKNNFIVYLLLFAMLVSFFVGKSVTAYVILVVILVVIATGFLQEYKAEKSIEKLKEMVMPVTIVFREGAEKEIPTRQLVPGDVISLRNGEKIPADCVILSEKNLLVNEAVLTGESDDIKKSATRNIKKASKENQLFAGSFIVDGKCTAKVVSTGMKTSFGKIAGMISTAEKQLPLQKKVNLISKYMALIAVVMDSLTGIIILFQSEVSEMDWVGLMTLIIAMCVSAFPEGFPVVLTTTLSAGSLRMARKNAIVNRMSIIETLGETTIICTDKTGTITKGEMTVKKIFLDNKTVDVTGVGYEGNGNFLKNKARIDPLKNKNMNLILKAAVQCNDSSIKRTGEDKIFQILGTPTEAALLVMASKADVYKEDFDPRIDEIPFSSERKMMSVLCKERGKKIVYTKGALEYILEKCTHIQKNNGVFRLLEKDKKKILKEKKKMASSAFRTLSFAYKETRDSGIKEDGFVFLGFVGMEDPPREGIKDALLKCKRAGIKIKMITGDDKETALSIAKQIGLNSGKIIEGYEIDNLSDKEFFRKIKNTVIFSRVKPEHKLRIVRALIEHGEIVTMTGDGVNDAPALKEAHIGVAMGKNGTDVSRSVADLTLKDDNFVTLVDAIKEGRTIFNNIRKFVTYQLSCNYSELMILFFGVLLIPFFGWPFPLLLALQILFMNIVTDNLPAITLGLNKSSEDIMDAKPRKDTNLLNKEFVKLLVFVGTLMTVFVLATFYFAFNYLGQSVEDARTTALLTLIILEVVGAFNFRSFRKTTLNRSPFVNLYLVIASAVSLIATVAIIYTPLNQVFETVPIPLIDWIIAIGFGFLLSLILDILKKVNYRAKFLKLN
ncbi:MAG: cation-transporting P-type ATPase [Candidatus Nanoarchaeia archaeon]|nr:cation-transporting P-type ATPase [Candidatus Nanoarchaeia archaeon]